MTLFYDCLYWILTLFLKAEGELSRRAGRGATHKLNDAAAAYIQHLLAEAASAEKRGQGTSCFGRFIETCVKM